MEYFRNDLSQNELDFFSHSLTLDPIKPLRCDRWVALSALQKSIRRGDSLTLNAPSQRSIETIRTRRGGGC
jgi:hypothetical protein